MIYPARATTREVRSLDTRARSSRARPLEESRGTSQSTRVTTPGPTPTPTPAATPAPAPFKSSLWDAFSGTPARTTTPPAANPTAAARNSATPSSAGSRVDAATSTTTRSGSTAGQATTLSTNTQGSIAQSTATQTTTHNQEAAPTPDVLTQVRDALTSIGLNPAEYNLRLGSLTISYPNIPTYEYPVLFADINGKTAGYYLNGVSQNPAIFAANVSSMIGRPVMYQV